MENLILETGECCTVEQSPSVKNANIVNNHKLPTELFIIYFMTNAERLIDMNRPAEEEAIKKCLRRLCN
jgi:hypothetical protein